MNKEVERALINNFVNPLDKGCNNNLSELDVGHLKHEETISLLKQAYKTLSNSYKLLNEYEFIDSNSLLRSAVEYLAMAMLIEENDDIYNEFIDLHPEERNYTSPTKILGKFGGKLKKYSSVLFDDTNRKERETLIIDFYDTLCSYTHSSLLISLFEHVEKAEDKEVLKMLMFMNYYFVKLILYTCLKHINKNKNDYLEINYIGVVFLFYINEVSIYIKENNIDFKNYNKYLHIDNKNQTYLDLHGERFKTILNEFKTFEMNDEEKAMFEKICKDFLKLN